MKSLKYVFVTGTLVFVFGLYNSEIKAPPRAEVFESGFQHEDFNIGESNIDYLTDIDKPYDPTEPVVDHRFEIDPVERRIEEERMATETRIEESRRATEDLQASLGEKDVPEPEHGRLQKVGAAATKVAKQAIGVLSSGVNAVKVVAKKVGSNVKDLALKVHKKILDLPKTVKKMLESPSAESYKQLSVEIANAKSFDQLKGLWKKVEIWENTHGLASRGAVGPVGIESVKLLSNIMKKEKVVAKIDESQVILKSREIGHKVGEARALMDSIKKSEGNMVDAEVKTAVELLDFFDKSWDYLRDRRKEYLPYAKVRQEEVAAAKKLDRYSKSTFKKSIGEKIVEDAKGGLDLLLYKKNRIAISELRRFIEANNPKDTALASELSEFKEVITWDEEHPAA